MHEHLFSNIILELFLNHHCIRLKSYIGPNLDVWIFAHPIIPYVKMASNIFPLALHTKLDLSHPTTCGFSSCICGQPIDFTWRHLFYYVHGEKHIATHDAIWDSFASISRVVEFHVLRKQIHILLISSFRSFWWQANIVFIANGIHTLTNVVIVNSTHVNLVLWVVFLRWVVETIVTQAKVVSCQN